MSLSKIDRTEPVNWRTGKPWRQSGIPAALRVPAFACDDFWFRFQALMHARLVGR